MTLFQASRRDTETADPVGNTDNRRWGAEPAARPSGQAVSRDADWQPPQTFRQRALKALSTPLLAGTTVFVLAVVVAVIVALLRPHEAGAGTSPEDPPGFTVETTEAAGEEAPAAVFVHVIGEVVNPGVVALDAGARVEAAIEAAGGATEAAVLTGVNLARVVVDGEQIAVPNAENLPETSESVEAAEPGSMGASINLNSASTGDLESLPRIGPALAARIVEWRDSNGPFLSVDDLLNVSGIGVKTLDGFRERVTV